RTRRMQALGYHEAASLGCPCHLHFAPLRPCAACLERTTRRGPGPVRLGRRALPRPLAPRLASRRSRVTRGGASAPPRRRHAVTRRRQGGVGAACCALLGLPGELLVSTCVPSGEPHGGAVGKE